MKRKTRILVRFNRGVAVGLEFQVDSETGRYDRYYVTIGKLPNRIKYWAVDGASVNHSTVWTKPIEEVIKTIVGNQGVLHDPLDGGKIVKTRGGGTRRVYAS